MHLAPLHFNRRKSLIVYTLCVCVLFGVDCCFGILNVFWEEKKWTSIVLFIVVWLLSNGVVCTCCVWLPLSVMIDHQPSIKY